MSLSYIVSNRLYRLNNNAKYVAYMRTRLACIVSTVCRTIVDRKSQTVFRTCKCTLETICIDDRFVRCSRDARRRCASLDRFSLFIACSRVRMISRNNERTCRTKIWFSFRKDRIGPKLFECSRFSAIFAVQRFINTISQG